jgi:hypothetical protein
MAEASSTSTLLLTLLMGIGLFFFIRASVKDRTQSVLLSAAQSEAELGERLRTYFTQRAYRPVAQADLALDLQPDLILVGNPQPEAQPGQVVLEGFVQPSWFLAGLLSFLAAIGLACMVLVGFMTTVLEPKGVWWGLVILAPSAGLFYWQKAGRVERIVYQVRPGVTQGEVGTSGSPSGDRSQVIVTAHRDEIMVLQKALALEGGAGNGH